MLVDVLKDGKIQQVEDNEVDLELVSPNNLLSTHVNSMPLHNAVAAPRLFYGARFINQAVPLVNREAALVQNLDKESGKSFEELHGERVGTIRAAAPGEVTRITDKFLEYRTDDGEKKRVDLYNNFPFNRLTGISQKPLLAKGDRFEAGAPIVGSNFTDNSGNMAMGVNARVGLVPYKGHSMDDALVISEAFAKKLTSEQIYTEELELTEGRKSGKGHFKSLFPTEYTKDQLDKLNDDGVPEVGTIINEGDPYILTTRPKMVTSSQAALGKLSRAMKNTRQNDSHVWHHKEPGIVTDVGKTSKGWKVVIKTEAPAKVGDKAVLRHGQKGIISKILEDDKMPRTEDGQPLEVLLNPLGIPSRVANAIVYDLILGKIAKKRGEPYKLPSFNEKNENWYDFIEKEMADNEVTDKERLYDPETDKFMENPVLVGVGNYLKLQHMAAKKISGRSQGAYDCYSEDTEVLTDRGWVLWPEVNASDKLYTPDLQKGTATYESPSRLVAYAYDGEMVGYSSRKVDFLVTPNHKFAYATPKVREWREDEVANLEGRSLYIPQFGYEFRDKAPAIKEFPNVPASRKRNKYEGTLAIPFEDYVQLAAWWASEGSVDEKGRLTIWQMPDVHPEESQEIYELLYRVTGKKPHTFADRGWRIQDPRIGSYFKNFGKDCYTKRLPEDLQHLPKPLARLFIETYIKGDGTFGEYSKEGRQALNVAWYAGSSSQALIESLQVMAIHAGLGMHYVVEKKEGTICNMPGGYTSTMKADFYGGVFHLSRKRAQIVSTNLSERDPRYKGTWYRKGYKGKVYCATTSTGYLMVRRNGKICVSGNSDFQPLKGGSEAAQSKRLGTLELGALASHGAYATMREGSTLRGAQNDDYWRALRQGQAPREPGTPFVWDKFRALLIGSGYFSRQLPGGKERLGPFTDKRLSELKPKEINSGEIVDINSMEPSPGGLFDPSLVGADKWGVIRLPEPVPNPAFEKQIALLLGIRQKDVNSILAGEMTLEEAKDR